MAFIPPLLMAAAYRDARRSQIATARALKSVTRLIANNASLNDLINTRFDDENSPPSDSEEALWLQPIDLDR